MYTKSPTTDSLERQNINQFNFWANNWGLKQNWQFVFSNRGILDVINPHAGSSILDVGCATGTLLLQLSKLDESLLLNGVDISPEMVKVAKRKIGKFARIQLGTADKLPYKGNSFDIVTCATSFHHYSNSQRAINEMFRVLKSKGKLIVLDPFTNGFLRKFICGSLNIVFKEKDIHLFAREEMSNLFRNAGFNRISQQPFIFYKLITVGEKSSK